MRFPEGDSLEIPRQEIFPTDLARVMQRSNASISRVTVRNIPGCTRLTDKCFTTDDIYGNF
ncbi:hypothetical protein RirG_097980 [Rhizophagus irregularis DAOM 197198w]|uniref:Uncharacterized protein n=1 Tax=Rhizophagus irregularis (strain DAOM 197198w) TaxID=1432141 RepID=A0A015JIC5_RHIIW|nr:hypothetical protein RirG_097980 [Rhizophagus irregularis DAOM 197198w]